MRRRFFWTILGVAVVTGLLVLIGSLVSTRREAVRATYRELARSASEAVLIVDEAIGNPDASPRQVAEVLRLLEDQQVGQLFARIRRSAGGSEIGVAALTSDGEVVSSSPLFARVDPDIADLQVGKTDETRSDTGELVVVSATDERIGNTEARLLVAVAREAPVVRIGDQMGAILLLIGGIGIVAALAARTLSGQLSKELQPLANASRSLAAGDLTVRVPDSADPDLGSVSEAFNEMAGELESASEREREFILGVGHDLRTPLTTIAGYAEALEAGDIAEEDLQRIGGVIDVQSRQLARLVEDLSTLARLEQPEFELRVESVDVGAHIAEVVAGFERRAGELGVIVVTNAAEGLVVETDADRLGQIASNLVENALRHTPETGTITVEVTRIDAGFTLRVSDTGAGISAEDLPRVFDRHFVGRQRSVRKEGTGLGLSIVKGIVEQMNGEVGAESNLGEGTSILVTLPAL